MVVLIIVAALFLIVGIVILVGKGDNLIAGYNTASKEERSHYNIKRLRGLFGGLLIILAPMTFLLGEESTTVSLSFSGITFIACIVVIILANTWAKERLKNSHLANSLDAVQPSPRTNCSEISITRLS